MIKLERDEGVLFRLAEGGRCVQLIGQTVDTLGDVPDLDLQHAESRDVMSDKED